MMTGALEQWVGVEKQPPHGDGDSHGDHDGDDDDDDDDGDGDGDDDRSIGTVGWG